MKVYSLQQMLNNYIKIKKYHFNIFKANEFTDKFHNRVFKFAHKQIWKSFEFFLPLETSVAMAYFTIVTYIQVMAMNINLWEN